MTRRDRCLAAALALGLFTIADARAETTGVQPAQGQSAEQMAKDQSECQASAKQSSGFDPAAPPPADDDERHVGGRVKGAAAGGAAGAAGAEVRGRQHDAYDDVSDDAKQEYRRNQAKDTAAAGAVVGASRQRRDRRADRREDREAEDALAKQRAAYDQAYKACLTGRGYTVP